MGNFNGGPIAKILVLLLMGQSMLSKGADIACKDIHSQWAEIKRDFGVQFVLNSDCRGTPGAFAKAAYMLKLHFPQYYNVAVDNTAVTRLGGPDPMVGADANKETKTMRIFDGFATATLETQMILLVHESAHMLSGVPRHVKCTGGLYVGRVGGCDQKYTAKKADGAYNHEMDFMFDMLLFGLEKEIFDTTAIADRADLTLNNLFNEVDPTSGGRIRRIIAAVRAKNPKTTRYANTEDLNRHIDQIIINALQSHDNQSRQSR